MEESSIRLAAPEVDKSRAEEGLPSDPEGERLADAPFMTMIPAELEDPNVTAPAAQAAFASK